MKNTNGFSLWIVALACLVLWTATSAAQDKKKPVVWTGDLAPISPIDWNYARAAHLLERAGFGGTPAEIERLARMAPEQAVNHLVDYQLIDNPLPKFEPSGIYTPGCDPSLAACPVSDVIVQGYKTGEAMGIKVKKEKGKRWLQPLVQQAYYHAFADRGEMDRVEQWWAQRMVATRRPLEEKMTLFWHGHFATSAARVRDYRLMLAQQEMLRRHATGNFRDLLLGIAQDPAMLVYLDNGLNVKGAPNENFAREIMELFSMGVGNYTEMDIRAAARAFTGWTNEGQKFVIKNDLHDAGAKTIFGETGDFDGKDVIDLILKQKATARFVTRRLYKFFVRTDLPKELETRLADSFRAGKYEVKPFLKMLFMSRDFYSPASYATQIKSPTQLAISTYRKLGLTKVPGIPDFRTVTKELGQELLHPPNVAGWEGGAAWINPATLLTRGNFVKDLLLPDAANYEIPDRPSLKRILRKMQQDLAANPPKMMMKDKDKKEDKSAASMLDTYEDFSLKDGVVWGLMKAYFTVKSIPRAPAKLDLRAMLKSAKATTADEAVAYCEKRFLRVPLEATDRKELVAFLTKQHAARLDYADAKLEPALRALVHLIMSLPEYQLS